MDGRAVVRLSQVAAGSDPIERDIDIEPETGLSEGIRSPIHWGAGDFAPLNTRREFQ